MAATNRACGRVAGGIRGSRAVEQVPPGQGTSFGSTAPPSQPRLPRRPPALPHPQGARRENVGLRRPRTRPSSPARSTPTGSTESQSKACTLYPPRSRVGTWWRCDHSAGPLPRRLHVGAGKAGGKTWVRSIRPGAPTHGEDGQHTCGPVPARARAQASGDTTLRGRAQGTLGGCAITEPGPPDLRAQHQKVHVSHGAKCMPWNPRDGVWLPGRSVTPRRDPLPGGSKLALERLEGKPGGVAYSQMPPLVGKSASTLAGPSQLRRARSPGATPTLSGARAESVGRDPITEPEHPGLRQLFPMVQTGYRATAVPGNSTDRLWLPLGGAATL